MVRPVIPLAVLGAVVREVALGARSKRFGPLKAPAAVSADLGLLDEEADRLTGCYYLTRGDLALCHDVSLLIFGGANEIFV